MIFNLDLTLKRNPNMATYTPNNLTDAQIFQAKYPDTVNAIDPFYWDRVQVDYYVRIRSNNEYFWVQVREVDYDNQMVTGEVYYELGTNPYSIGDQLIFEFCRMFDVYDPQIFNLIPGIEPFQYKRGSAVSP